MYLKRLRDLREYNDLTQKKVGDILHITQTNYSAYERGKRTMPVEYLILLADHYGVTLDYLVGRSTDKA